MIGPTQASRPFHAFTAEIASPIAPAMPAHDLGDDPIRGRSMKHRDTARKRSSVSGGAAGWIVYLEDWKRYRSEPASLDESEALIDRTRRRAEGKQHTAARIITDTTFRFREAARARVLPKTRRVNLRVSADAIPSPVVAVGNGNEPCTRFAAAWKHQRVPRDEYRAFSDSRILGIISRAVRIAACFSVATRVCFPRR